MPKLPSIREGAVDLSLRLIHVAVFRTIALMRQWRRYDPLRLRPDGSRRFAGARRLLANPGLRSS
jgi:hypothetical protein